MKTKVLALGLAVMAIVAGSAFAATSEPAAPAPNVQNGSYYCPGPYGAGNGAAPANNGNGYYGCRGMYYGPANQAK